MREIKFRGISERTGEFVYGYYVPTCPMSSNPGIVDDDDIIHEVKPESIAQFLDYDANGREVYEGDELTDGEDKFYAVHFDSVAIEGNYSYFGNIDMLELKEPNL